MRSITIAVFAASLTAYIISQTSVAVAHLQNRDVQAVVNPIEARVAAAYRILTRLWTYEGRSV